MKNPPKTRRNAPIIQKGDQIIITGPSSIAGRWNVISARYAEDNENIDLIITKGAATSHKIRFNEKSMRRVSDGEPFATRRPVKVMNKIRIRKQRKGNR